MPRTHPAGGHQRYGYVPFHELTPADQDRVRGGYPHKVSHLPDEEYLYPIKKNGRLAMASRWISNERAKQLWDEVSSSAQVIADAMRDLGYDAEVRTRPAAQEIILTRPDTEGTIAVFAVEPDSVVVLAEHIGGLVANLLSRAGLAKHKPVRRPRHPVLGR